MKSIKKRILPFFLSVTMIILTLCPALTAYAASNEPVIGNTNESIQSVVEKSSENSPQETTDEKNEALDNLDNNNENSQKADNEILSQLPDGVLGEVIYKIAQGVAVIFGFPLFAVLQMFRSPMVFVLIIPLMILYGLYDILLN